MTKQIKDKIWLNFLLINETLNLERRISNIFYVSLLPYPVLPITTITSQLPKTYEGGDYFHFGFFVSFFTSFSPKPFFYCCRQYSL